MSRFSPNHARSPVGPARSRATRHLDARENDDAVAGPSRDRRSVDGHGLTRLATTVGTRLAPGCVFLVFGADEFVNHARNVHSFTAYGLPSPSLFSYAIGTLEIVGGLALISGIALLPVAVALAGDMVGAIVVSGIALGELVSLTLAPAMLAAMLVLIARELSGRRAAGKPAESLGFRARSKAAVCAGARGPGDRAADEGGGRQ
jgi:putative oxidoreductase